MVRVKRGLILIFIFTSLLIKLSAQDCSIFSKANKITPDRLCSPVKVSWEVWVKGVNNNGAPVEIQFDWDDGSVQTFTAINTNPDPLEREWSFIASHTYTSHFEKCNYHPLATLIVNGQVCSSSTQEQIVTIWDNDNTNGGKLLIDPPVYPICFGNGDNVRFQDNTLFNCVPPQEKDVPNVNTRWIQWIYGTDITMTGVPVTINGAPQVFPYSGNIITLPGPVTGSGIFSEVMNVANDKLVGQYFQVTLRYWNYCNPYDDPLIPGPPADPVNGDHPPMTTTAIILIVPYPDAEIVPIPPVCADGDKIFLSAADAGGKWSGNGIVDADAGAFVPEIAGVGDHIIRYEIMDANKCSDWDTVVIKVMPLPNADITPIPPQCDYNPDIKLLSAAGSGTWSGPGIIDPAAGTFSPAFADSGIHLINFTSNPDVNGCIGKAQVNIEVRSAPHAEFISPDSAWCEPAERDNYARIKIEGSFDNNYRLKWEANGIPETFNNISNDTFAIKILSNPGMNTYHLTSIMENFGSFSCERAIDDLLRMKVNPKPDMNLTINPDGFCSPIGVGMTGPKGDKYKYSWEYGDGATHVGDTSFTFHTFYNPGVMDTSYITKLKVTTNDGCMDTISRIVYVYPNPKADFFVSPRMQEFPDSKVILNNYSGDGIWNYFWDFGDGETASAQEPGEYIYNLPGDYNIMLKVYSVYCADSLSKAIQILSPVPNSGFMPDSAGCGPLTIPFRNKSTYAQSYLWDFDDGTFSTEENPVHTFYKARDYKVTLTATGKRGKSISSNYIIVYPDPVASFNAYPETGTRIDQVFKFLNNSEGAVKYKWEFGDGNTSDDAYPSHVYGKEGEFDIFLQVWSEHDCPDTTLRMKYIKLTEGEGKIRFPNAFRWNGSGPTGGYWAKGTIDNTVFHPVFENVMEYKLLIYSRWGEQLYDSEDLYKGWDGYIKGGKKAPQGVYVYKAWIKYYDGETEIKAGDVTFLH